MYYVTISQKLKFSVNALLKNKNCFANILRTDRDISKIPTDTNLAKLRLSAEKISLKDKTALLKKPKI